MVAHGVGAYGLGGDDAGAGPPRGAADGGKPPHHAGMHFYNCKCSGSQSVEFLFLIQINSSLNILYGYASHLFLAVFLHHQHLEKLLKQVLYIYL